MLQNGSRSRIELTVDYVTDKLSQKANIDSPTFTGIPKAPTPTENASNTQIVTVEYVKNATKGGGLISSILAQDGGSIDATAQTITSFGEYTVKNDCYLRWSAIIDNANGGTLAASFYSQIRMGNDWIALDGIGSLRPPDRPMVFCFNGPVKAGTKIRMYMSSGKFHYSTWRAVEFALS